MAELFFCCGEPVYLTNGGTTALFEGWERLARADTGRPGMKAVADYLRRRIDGSGVGCMAFGMDREHIPNELGGPAEIAALLSVAERVAIDPTLIPDVDWSAELLRWWEPVLAPMVRALRSQVV